MEKIIIFDEFGDQYMVDNIVAMLDEMPEEGLEVIYKASRYFNHFNLHIEEMKDKGVIQQIEGEDYDKEAVERGLTYFADKITEKLGADTLTTWNEETDAQWEANSPDSDVQQN